MKKHIQKKSKTIKNRKKAITRPPNRAAVAADSSNMRLKTM